MSKTSDPTTDSAEQTAIGETHKVPISNFEMTDGARQGRIEEDHVDWLEHSINSEGLISPITVTKASGEGYQLVDGRHRVKALEKLGVEELIVLTMPGELDWAVPSEEAEADLDIQSMAANAVRMDQTQTEEVEFLIDQIEERILTDLDEETIEELAAETDADASARVKAALQCIYRYDDADEETLEGWPLERDHYEVMKRIEFALGIGKPRTMADHVLFYTTSPEDVTEAWEAEDITKTQVKHLRQIENEDLRKFALERARERSESDDEDTLPSYSTRNLETIRELDSLEMPSVNELVVEDDPDVNVLGRVVEHASSGNLEEDEVRAFIEEPTSLGEAENEDGENQQEDEGNKDGGNEEENQETDENESSKKVLEALSPLELFPRLVTYHQRKQGLADVEWANTPFEEGNEVHKAPPILIGRDGSELDTSSEVEWEDIEAGVFFHDNIRMDLEIPEEFLHLVFFSPPYFDQSGSMPIGDWVPEDVGAVETEEDLSRTYENYLDWLTERIEVFTSRLKPGRAMVINVSDIQHQIDDAPPRRFNLPANLSTRLELGVDELRYEGTIQWVKKRTSAKRGGQYWSEKDYGKSVPGYPLYYYPQDSTEQLLIFRKNGKPDHSEIIGEAMERFEEPPESELEFKQTVAHSDPAEPFERILDGLESSYLDPRDNVWLIEQDSSDRTHQVGFPRKLARLVVEQYTLPGERIADPFVGQGTTLRAVQAVNLDQDDEWPMRQGFGWENFSSEWSKEYYVETKERLCRTGLMGYKFPLNPV